MGAPRGRHFLTQNNTSRHSHVVTKSGIFHMKGLASLKTELKTKALCEWLTPESG